MPLTDTAIKALKPRSARYTVTDEKGLVLEVFPTGGLLWHHRYRLNGKQERVTLGRYKAGLGTILDVLNAQRALASARQQQIQALYKWHVARVSLAQAMGTLDRGMIDSLEESAKP